MADKKEVIKSEEKSIEKTRELRSAIPAVDIYENDDEILLRADMPGVSKDDISINIDKGRLSLSGVRKFENKGVTNWEAFGDVEYVRNFSVPQSIDVDGINAKLKYGVLELHLPKSEAAKPKSIEIKAA